MQNTSFEVSLFSLLTLFHGSILLIWPEFWVIGLGIWWNSNTIAHYFIHRPFFEKRWKNRAFALFQSFLLGIPQTLWRQRHLAHHKGKRAVVSWNRDLTEEILLIGVLWAALLVFFPSFFVWTYLPGLLAGLGICQIHGYFEHYRGPVSHYGVVYNLIFFNDGYHVEHHKFPNASWSEIRKRRQSGTSESAWPAPLRWLDLLDSRKT